MAFANVLGVLFETKDYKYFELYFVASVSSIHPQIIFIQNFVKMGLSWVMVALGSGFLAGSSEYAPKVRQQTGAADVRLAKYTSRRKLPHISSN